MISASKSTLSLNNLISKHLRSRVTKNLTNLNKKFCEFPPRTLIFVLGIELWRNLDILDYQDLDCPDFKNCEGCNIQ